MFRNETHRPVISEEPQSRVQSPTNEYPSSRTLPQRLVHLLHVTEMSFIFKPCWNRVTSELGWRSQLHDTLASICHQPPFFSIVEEVLLEIIVV